MRDIQQVFASTHMAAPGNTERFNHSPDFRRSDEIDLIELLAFFVRTVKRYRVILLTSVVVGLIAGLILCQVVSPSHEKELVCSVTSVDRQALSTILVEFESKRKAANSSDVLSGLRSLEILEASNSAEGNSAPFVIQGKFSSNADVRKIQASLIQHVESNPFVEAQIQLEKEKMKKTIAMLKADELRIAELLNDAKNLESESFSVADMSKLKMDFYRERIALEGKLENFSAVRVIQDFTGKTPSPIKNALLTVGGSLLIALFLAASYIIVSELGSALKRHERRVPSSNQNTFMMSGESMMSHDQPQKKVS